MLNQISTLFILLTPSDFIWQGFIREQLKDLKNHSLYPYSQITLKNFSEHILICFTDTGCPNKNAPVAYCFSRDGGWISKLGT